MNWLVLSLVLSIVLTVGLNLAVRAFPGGPQRLAERSEQWMTERGSDEGSPRVRVFFPWKAMLLASIGLTVLLNLIAALSR